MKKKNCGVCVCVCVCMLACASHSEPYGQDRGCTKKMCTGRGFFLNFFSFFIPCLMTPQQQESFFVFLFAPFQLSGPRGAESSGGGILRQTRTPLTRLACRHAHAHTQALSPNPHSTHTPPAKDKSKQGACKINEPSFFFF